MKAHARIAALTLLTVAALAAPARFVLAQDDSAPASSGDTPASGDSARPQGDSAQPQDSAQGAQPQDGDSAQGAGGSAQAGDGPAARATPKEAPDPAFLNLPAFDVEARPAPAQVGDRVQLRVLGAAPPGAQGQPGAPVPGGAKGAAPAHPAFQLSVPRGTEADAPLDQGLDLAQSAGTASGNDLVFDAIVAKAGQLAIPSLAILGPEGTAIGRTNPFSVEVRSVIPPDDKNAQDAAPPRPPMRLTFPWIILVLLGILCALAIAGAIYGIVRLAKSTGDTKPAPGPTAPPKTEDQLALEALAELERAGLMERGQFKRHYFTLSETLKAYVGARYQVDAVEATTREMLMMIEHATLPPGGIRELEGMFVKLDFVKFTDHVPETQEGRELLESARGFVQKTRRPPPSITPILPAAAAPAGGSRAV